MIQFALHRKQSTGIRTRTEGGGTGVIQLGPGTLQLIRYRTDHGVGPLLFHQKSLAGKPEVVAGLLQIILETVDLPTHRLGRRRASVFRLPEGFSGRLQFVHQHLALLQAGLEGYDFAVGLSQVSLQARRIRGKFGLDGLRGRQFVLEPVNHL